MTNAAAWIDPKENELEMFKFFALMDFKEYHVNCAQKLVDHKDIVCIARMGLRSGELKEEELHDWAVKAFDRWVWGENVINAPRKFFKDPSLHTGKKGRPAWKEKPVFESEAEPPNYLTIKLSAEGSTVQATVYAVWLTERVANRPGRTTVRNSVTRQYEVPLGEDYVSFCIESILEEAWTEFGNKYVQYVQDPVYDEKFVRPTRPIRMYVANDGQELDDSVPAVCGDTAQEAEAPLDAGAGGPEAGEALCDPDAGAVGDVDPPQ